MSDRRTGWLLFALAWLTFAWFHEGGGWNQNARFALVRAIVETGTPWVDEYAVYRAPDPATSSRLVRYPVRSGRIESAHSAIALAWSDSPGGLAPIDPTTPPGTRLIALQDISASGDLAYAHGHLHPNKAPGTSLAGVPAYALAYAIERAAGIDPDDARVLTINAWWTGAGSVGVIAALGVVLFFRCALRLSEGDSGASLAATLAFALGTLYLPYATMLYEHDLVAVATLAAVFLVLEEDVSAFRLVLAGALLGVAVLTSYLAVVAAAIVAGYVLWRTRSVYETLLLAAGLVPPLLLLAAYNAICFGTVFTTNYAWQNPLFKDSAGGFLGVFRLPDPGVLLALLVSPFRGLFFTAPALLLGGFGLVRMIGSARWRKEAWLFAALAAYPLVFNVTFAAWHGGWAAGPRYLVPSLPFLALPIVFALDRARAFAGALIALSIAANLLVTAVDPEPPLGTAIVPAGRAQWTVSPLLEFDGPLFARGRLPAELRGDTEFPLQLWSSPVSANPQGFYEPWPVTLFPAGSAIVRGNSFNAGEWLLPGSRASLVPLLLALAAGAYALWRPRPK